MRALLRIAVLALPVLVVRGASAVGADAPPQAFIDLDFPGGSLAEYVAAVRQAGGNANIVMMHEAQGIEIPAVQLKQVTIGAALGLVRGEFQPDDQTMLRIQLDEIGPWGADEQPVYRISASVHRPRRHAPTEARVWSVADLLAAEIKAEDILTAVETAVELLAKAMEPAEIRFHEPTGLIIARGHPDQMRAIEEVIDQLRGTVEMRREAQEGGHTGSLADLFAWIEDMKRLEVEAAREGGAQVLEQAEGRIEELRALMTEHARLAEELRSRDQEQARQRGQLHREIERLRQQLEQKEVIIRELENRVIQPQRR